MKLENDEQKTSYALGLNMAMQIAQMPLSLDRNAFMEGFLDMLDEKKPQITQQEFTSLLEKLFSEIEKQHKHGHNCECGECGCDCEGDCDGGCGGAENKKAGDAYREENAKKEGVIVTESGLQVLITDPGTGRHPSATDTVKVHYTGKLIDGKVFDSSVERGEPIEFPLNRVIQGWTEGMQMIGIGGKATLVIPPELGYGEAGAGNVIPPQATLVFDVELIDIK